MKNIDILYNLLKDKDLDWDEIKEIVDAFHNEVSIAMIEILANAGLYYAQLSMLVRMAIIGFTEEQIKLMANPKFNLKQLEVIEGAFVRGLTTEQVSFVADPEINGTEMKKKFAIIKEYGLEGLDNYTSNKL